MPVGVGRVGILVGLLAALVAVSGLAAPLAEAKLVRVSKVQGPLHVEGYGVRFTSNRTRAVKAPRMNGYIVRMHTRLVDRRGRPIPVKRVMLHHIVYKNLGRFRGDRRDGACGGGSESFYGRGEENERLVLPQGYGYRIRKRDRWLTGWMLMNHRHRTQKAYIKYTAVIETRKRLRPVKPYWLRATGCNHAFDPIFNVPGGGKPGSVHAESASWTVPRSGRLVAGGAHLHGGAKPMVLSQQSCRGRSLFVSHPIYGLPSHPYYNVLPVLHEPGPIKSSWNSTRTGIPIRRGETLRVTSLYDAERLHTRVMGIFHVYVAHGGGGGPAVCAPLPGDLRNTLPGVPHRKEPPKIRVPLTGLDENGRARRIERPPGPTLAYDRSAQVSIEDSSFSVRNLSIPLGASVKWLFRDRGKLHDVTVADGPFGFGAPWDRRRRQFEQRFSKSGTYKLFCTLHPIDMTQTVQVRP